MDDNDRFTGPAADPPGDGLPETADPDSHADEELDAVRISEGPEPAALPSDRDDRVQALDEYGTTPAEERRDEPLEARLAREEPDVGDTGGPAEGTRAESEYVDEEPVPPRLESHVSVYDRPLHGVPSSGDVGRLVQPDEGAHGDTEATEIAYDAGAFGGVGAEDAAMHQIPPSQEAGEEAEADLDPDPAAEDTPGEPAETSGGKLAGPSPPKRPVFRTGSDQPWDPEDLAVAEGRDPTPKNVERARRELEELGPAAIEKTVP